MLWGSSHPRRQSGTAEIGGLRLHYELQGQGEPLLLIAGLGRGSDAWDALVAGLRHHFLCIGYDQRDTGASDLAAGPYTIKDLAADAAGLLERLGIVRAHIAGWSMGGAVAQELAIGWPERVDRLALIATYAKGDARGAANLHSWALLRQRLAPADYQRIVAPWVFSPREYEQAGLVEASIECILSRPAQPQAAFERQVEATVTHDAAARLNCIRAPTLLLFGGDDALTPLRFAHELQAAISDAGLIVLPGAGHGLISTREEEVRLALQGFFKVNPRHSLVKEAL